jgi:hypothetical protein
MKARPQDTTKIADQPQREQYEGQILICVHALLAELQCYKRKEELTFALTRLYRELWDYLVPHGLQLKYSPELSAMIFTVLFYQDMIAHKIGDDMLAEIRRCIRDNEHHPARQPLILFHIQLTTRVANGWASDNRISVDDYRLALRDLHRVVFDDNDQNLDTTLAYFSMGHDELGAGQQSGAVSLS